MYFDVTKNRGMYMVGTTCALESVGSRQVSQESGRLTPNFSWRGAGRRPEAILALVETDQDHRRVGGEPAGWAIVAKEGNNKGVPP